MDLEGSKLCKTSQTEKDRCYIVSLSLICETFLKKKEPQTHQREIKDWERGIRGSTDVVTMKANITPDMEVKASGGIKTLEDALTMIKVGATRIGTSSGIAIIEAYNAQEVE